MINNILNIQKLIQFIMMIFEKILKEHLQNNTNILIKKRINKNY